MNSSREDRRPPGRVETPRLVLRPIDEADAVFVLELVNEPGWLRFIGDRGIRDLQAARNYIEQGPMAMYRSHGHGLMVVVERRSAIPVGICGLLKREELEHVDLGFALLARYEGRGYAGEAARAILDQAPRQLGISRVLAITTPDNRKSICLLDDLGMRPDGNITTAEGDELLRFALDLESDSA